MSARGIAGGLAASAGLELTGGAPWWAYFIAALAGLLVYICRQLVVMKLGSKALDKVEPDRVPEVMNAVTGYRSPRRSRRSRLDEKS